MEFWRFGGTPQPAAEVGRIAKRLEDLGWDGLVVGEDAGVIAEPYVYLSAAAACTSRLRLGTGVSVPLRHPIQAASAAAALQAISAGRFRPSYGRGDGGLAILGRPPLNVAQFFDYVRQVKAYLEHDVVQADGFDNSLERLFTTDPSIGAARTPIDISATGPRMIAQAAQFADGVTFAVGADITRLRQCVTWANEACDAAGRDRTSFTLSAYVPVAVAVNGDQRVSSPGDPRRRAAPRPLLSLRWKGARRGRDAGQRNRDPRVRSDARPLLERTQASRLLRRRRRDRRRLPGPLRDRRRAARVCRPTRRGCRSGHRTSRRADACADDGPAGGELVADRPGGPSTHVEHAGGRIVSDGMVAGKIALVTGAGSGIGRCTALLLGDEGAAGVVVSDADEASALDTVRLMDAKGQTAIAVRADVSEVDDVQALVAVTVARFGRLDSAVNNAGVRGRLAPITDVDDDEWHRVIGVNLDGMFYCLRAEITAMKSTGGGAIVNISSGSTADPKAELGPYVASKFGVLGLTRVAAAEVARDNIRVNAVLPGSTRTTMLEEYLAIDSAVEAKVIATMPQGRLGTPDELAEAIVWLCSVRSSFVNAVSLLVDGGMHSFAQRPRPNEAGT